MRPSAERATFARRIGLGETLKPAHSFLLSAACLGTTAAGKQQKDAGALLWRRVAAILKEVLRA